MNQELINRLNDHYRDLPPEYILDSETVRHWKEVPLAAEYGTGACNCWGEHHVDSETWYHKTLQMTPTSAAIFRACKHCNEILIRKRVDCVKERKFSLANILKIFRKQSKFREFA